MIPRNDVSICRHRYPILFVAVASLLLLLCCQALAQSRSVHFHEQEINYADELWHINVKFPQIDGDEAFNSVVQRSATEQADTFRKQMEFFDADKDRPNGEGYMEGSYSATMQSNGVISVLFTYDEYTPGAVHPWGVMESVNYDTRNHRVLALADLFRPGSSYVKRLSKIAIASLEQHEGAEEGFIRHGAGPLESNFKVFTLTDTELVLLFQQYQVAPGVVPFEQVKIPLTSLAPILRKQYQPPPEASQRRK